MANKITKKEMFTKLLGLSEVQNDTQFVEFIEHEIELLDKKASNKKPSKTQSENENLKGIISGVLKVYGKSTISEIQSKDEKLAPLSNQKMSALLRQLVDVGTVVREMEKKVPYFYIVTTDDEEGEE